MLKQRDKHVKIGNKRYLMTSDDSYLDYISKGFEPEMVRLFELLCKDSDTILDIGANIGCTAILFGTMAKQVFAFEPSTTTFKLLETNVQRAGHSNVSLINSGLGKKPYNTTLTFSPANRAGGFVSNQTQASIGHTVEEISIRPLDDLIETLNTGHINFIKIDVEGFEGDVLQGASKTLEAHKPVVVLELNHWCLNAFQRTSVPDFFDLLRSIFPVLLAVDGNSHMNLHDESDSYIVMYHHILHMRFQNIVAAFDEQQLAEFRKKYHHDFQE